MRYKTLIALPALLFFLLIACERKEEELGAVPPSTNPLSRELIGYGVVNVSYIHVVDKPGLTETSRGYLRRGAIVHIVERRSFSAPALAAGASKSPADSWVLVEGSAQGWLPEQALDIYDSESRARTASEAMTP